MNIEELKKIAEKGEDGLLQFKSDVTNTDSLAAEMAAFANSNGGMILIGITDHGDLRGLTKEDVRRVNSLISNSASQHVRSPLSVKSENILLKGGRVIIVVTVPPGIDKPYFDKNGVIWLKCGSDKRRVNSKEELRRLFQASDQFHADELPTKANVSDLDRERLREFLNNKHRIDIPDSKEDFVRLLETLNVATTEGKLTLAGVLMFAKSPQRFRPQFLVKAASFPGNKIHTTDYRDMEDVSGTIPKMFADAKAFILRNLRKVQAGQGVNAPGIPEIPEVVIEELLVNAFVHRDYLVSAPIRIFVFDDRVEIISPGHLPNNLTIDKIKVGNSNSRNPILLSLAAQGLLPYRGLGSGIRRAVEECPNISFTDDHEGCLFKCSIPRLKGQNTAASTDKGAILRKGEGLSELQEMILFEVKGAPGVAYDDLATLLGKDRRTIARNIQKLKDRGLMRRIGSKKTGHWEVLDDQSLTEE